MEAAVEIKSKREALGLTIKEFSDAIGLGKDGDKLFRAWEAGSEIPSQEQLDKVLSFAVDQPYVNQHNDIKFN